MKPMTIRWLAAVATVGISPGALAGQALPYDRTLFLSGLNGNPTWWSPAVVALDQQLHLGTVAVPSISTTSSLVDQSVAVRGLFAWGQGGKAVLVGHSFGGLVSRRIAVDDSTRVFGIVTVGTPVRGARVTAPARIGILRFRIQDAIWRVGDVVGIFGQRQALLDAIGMTNGGGNLLTQLFPSGTAAWVDLQQNSSAVQATYSGTGPSVGLAQVIGSVPQAGVHYRLMASLNGTPSSWMMYRQADHIFRGTCRLGRVAGYASLVFFSVARKCGFAINTLEKIDVAFVDAVKGQTVLQSLLFPKSFDGIVAGDDAQWIGWGSPFIFHVPNVDHLALQYVESAVTAQRNALLAVGVLPR
jgi:pimeloyl-ACP methyl ester carboxylesterase